MIRVLLVEDDSLYRQALKKMLPWTREGYTLYADATNGKEALNIIRNDPPDLLVTDIIMPVMNGVELIRQVKAEFPNIYILVLSAYEDFQYVKEALKAGAEDYFLKIDLNEKMEMFLEILRAIRGKIYQTGGGQPQIMQRLQVSSLLWYIVSGKFSDPQEAERGISQAFLTSYFSRYRIVSIQTNEYNRYGGVEEPAAAIDAKTAATFELALYGLETPLDDAKSPPNLCALFERGCGICIQNMTGVFSQTEARRRQQALFRQMQNAFPGDFSMSIGPESMGISQVENAYRNAVKQQMTYLLGDGAVMIDRPAALTDARKAKIGEDINRYLHRFTASYSDEDAGEFHGLVNAVWGTGCADMLRQFMEALNQTCGELALPLIDLLPEPECAHRFRNPQSVCDAYQIVFNHAFRHTQSAKNPTIVRAIAFLDKHFAEPVSLPDIAREIGVSSNYLSNAFMADTGIHLIEYLNRIRIKSAVRMMRDPQLKTADIAAMCGFLNISYFYMQFKKTVGTGVKQYRRWQMLQ
jgi:two-component system, response regulator YesN